MILLLVGHPSLADRVRGLLHEIQPLRDITDRDAFVRSLDTHVPQAVIAIGDLPDIDRIEALQLASEYAPGTPFLVVVGNSEQTAAHTLLEHGAYDYIREADLDRLPTLLDRIAASNRAEESRVQAELEQRTILQGFRSILDAVDELVHCPSTDDLYRLAVELARREIGLERCAIYLESEDELVGTYGTDMHGATTNEQYRRRPLPDAWRPFFSPPGDQAPRWHLLEGRRLEGDASHDGHPADWLVITPIPGVSGEPLGIFANDASLTQAPLDTSRQELLAAYCSHLGSLVEQRTAKERLRQTESRYRALVEQLPAVTYLVDVKANLKLGTVRNTRYISPQVESILGFTPEEWMADPECWIRQIYPEDRARVLRMTALANKTGDPFYLEYRVLTRDGRVRWFQNSAQYVLDEQGQPMMAQGVMFDITDSKTSQEKERELGRRLARARRMESIGQLAGSVAHDLNNILGPVVGYPDLILEELPDNSPLRLDLQAMRDSAARAADIIQDLLNLARRGNIRAEPVLLNQVIEAYRDTADFRALQTEHPHVTDVFRLDPGLQPVQGSIPHLSKMLMNLLINGMEAMPDGGRLAVTTSNQLVRRAIDGYEVIPPNDYAVLRVRDEGTGIRPEDLERIFEPFYSTKTMGRSGSGLGLAVVYGVIKDHQGFIDIITETGRGTTFALYFPITLRRPTEKKTEQISFQGSETILVVDDVPEQRELATRTLGSLGYTVITAVNGREAVEFLQHHRVDLVVLDMIMEEDFDGLETYRALAHIWPGQRCIIASGFAETERVKQAEILGVGQFIRKPYSLKTLGRAVRTELDR